MNVILLTPKTALSFVWGIPVSLWLLVQSALFASPQTTLRIGGAACLAVAAVFFARAVRALLAARAAAASGAQQVVVEETPLDGLEALRRSMASYDQAVVRARGAESDVSPRAAPRALQHFSQDPGPPASAASAWSGLAPGSGSASDNPLSHTLTASPQRGLPPLLYQTAASNPAIAPELLASSEKLFAAESALDDVEEMFKGKGVVAYTTTVTTNAQVLKLGPAGPQPMAGPKGPAATIVSPPRAALGAKAQGGALTPTLPPPPPPAAAAAPKPAPPAAAAPTPAAQAKPASGFQPQMTVADRAAESMYMQTVESSGKYSVENYRKVATEVTAALDMLKPVATFVSVSEGSATSVDGDESRDGNAGGQRGKDERGR